MDFKNETYLKSRSHNFRHDGQVSTPAKKKQQQIIPDRPVFLHLVSLWETVSLLVSQSPCYSLSSFSLPKDGECDNTLEGPEVSGTETFFNQSDFYISKTTSKEEESDVYYVKVFKSREFGTLNIKCNKISVTRILKNLEI